MHFVLTSLLSAVAATGAHHDNGIRANALITKMAAASGANAAHTVQVNVVLRDFSHPKHAGDAWEGHMTGTLSGEPARALLAIELRDGSEPEADRYLVRDGSLLQWKDKQWTSIDAEGELLPSTFVKFDPLALIATIAAHRENAQLLDASTLLFAFQNELLRVHVDPKTSLPASVEKSISNPLFGDLLEVTTYASWSDRGTFRFPSRITITDGGRERAALDVERVSAGSTLPELPKGSELTPLVAEDIQFRELAPRLFAADLTVQNTRVYVAEFDDFVFVIEGVFNGRNGDVLVRRIHERFGKPIRYHSFSHIHGQYVGSVRSFIADGATIVTTPTGAEYVRQIAASTHGFDADALSANPRVSRIEVVKTSRTIEDAGNTIVIFNVESQHTDDYNVFYFPRSKTILSGDLLCVRGVDQPLKSRSKLFVTDVAKLGIDVERAFITWPLDNPCKTSVAWSDVLMANAK